MECVCGGLQALQQAASDEADDRGAVEVTTSIFLRLTVIARLVPRELDERLTDRRSETLLKFREKVAKLLLERIFDGERDRVGEAQGDLFLLEFIPYELSRIVFLDERTGALDRRGIYNRIKFIRVQAIDCLLYTSDAADDIL
jgi:hypothetical protein